MIKIKYADSYFKRLTGLMFKKDVDWGLVFILKYGSSVHTCFMRFDIDVYFMDENKTVFEKTTLKPWKYYKPSKKARYILEVKKDSVKYNVDDRLNF